MDTVKLSWFHRKIKNIEDEIEKKIILNTLKLNA